MRRFLAFSSISRGMSMLVDKTYPGLCLNLIPERETPLRLPAGTAVARLEAVHARVATLTKEQLSSDWPDARRSLLWAGGLRDLESAVPVRSRGVPRLPRSRAAAEETRAALRRGKGTRGTRLTTTTIAI